MKPADYMIRKERKKKPQLTIQTLNLIKKSSTMQQTQSGSIHFNEYDWKIGANGIRATGTRKNRFSEDFDYKQLKIIQELGRGGQSEVKLCKYKDLGLHALKVYFLDGRSHEYANESKEIDILQRIDHKFIVRMEQAFTRDQRIYLLLEYMNCGSLREIINSMGQGIRNERVLSHMASQMLESLRYLHEDLGVVHCDIKPSNFLVSTKGYVKLTDFGLAMNKHEEIDPSLGTKQYKSPQCLEFRNCTERCDVWAFGMTIAELWKGDFPLPINEGDACELGGPNAGGAVQKTPFARCISCGGSDFLKKEDYPPDLYDFVRNCLCVDDSQRMNASQLLRHPFITKFNSVSSSSSIQRNCVSIQHQQQQNENRVLFDQKREIGAWSRPYLIRIAKNTESYTPSPPPFGETKIKFGFPNEKMTDVVHLAVSSGPSPHINKKKKKERRKKKISSSNSTSSLDNIMIMMENENGDEDLDDEDDNQVDDDDSQGTNFIKIIDNGEIRTI